MEVVIRRSPSVISVSTENASRHELTKQMHLVTLAWPKDAIKQGNTWTCKEHKPKEYFSKFEKTPQAKTHTQKAICDSCDAKPKAHDLHQCVDCKVGKGRAEFAVWKAERRSRQRSGLPIYARCNTLALIHA